jgi:hypothetical protein
MTKKGCSKCSEQVPAQLTRDFLGVTWCAGCLVLGWWGCYLLWLEYEGKGLTE